jgi:hypothetical protein
VGDVKPFCRPRGCEDAEQDVEKAKAEYEQAQREVGAIIDDHLARAGQ